jgi:UDP-N-acetylmuramyl tripeptide synthase
MTSVAAVSLFYRNVEEIIYSLKDLQCDLSFNPGRQNILDFGKFKVILDYGHNSEAFREVFSIAKSLNPARLTGIIAAAGDRMDKYISELGTVASEYCDNIIIREQADLRGRKPGESASLIKEGGIKGGFSESNLSIIYKEEDAIVYAMENAEDGEVIVLFTQCLDVIIPVINKFLKANGKAPIGEGIDFSH